MAICTFNRIEQKFMLDDEQYEKLLPIIEKYAKIDSYSKGGGYEICNIYFDTDNNEVIRKSIAKPYYKEKLRLRSYGTPKDDDTEAFLEIKKKIGKNVIKRRIVMPLGVIEGFLKTKEIPDSASAQQRQIMNEMLYFMKLYDIKPAVYIRYKRIAYAGREDKELRITFDTEILTRRYDVDLRLGVYGEDILKEHQHLMEIKIPGAMPMWLSKALSELGIFKRSFSKYGTEYKLSLNGQI